MEMSYPNERTKGRIAKLLRYCGIRGGAELSTDDWYKLKTRVSSALEKNKKMVNEYDAKMIPAKTNELIMDQECIVLNQ